MNDDEEESAYLKANGWRCEERWPYEWVNEKFSTRFIRRWDAVPRQRAYDMGRADALAEVQNAKPAPVESEKDEAMSKTSFRFTLDTAVLSSERVLRLPNSDYGIKLCCKHGKPSVMLEIGCRVVNRYDTVVEALSRAYIGSDVEHLIEEKYSVTPKKPDPDEEFILRHMWWKTSSGLWVHDDVRHTDGDHASFLKPLNAAAVQRAINRAAEKAVAEARSHNA